MTQQSLPSAFKNAGKGIWSAIKNERNMKIHLAVAAFAIAVGLVLRVELWGMAIILVCIGAMFALEVLNHAIEAIVDLVSPDYHPLAGRAKDAAAGAVLCMAVVSVIVGLLLYADALFRLLEL